MSRRTPIMLCLMACLGPVLAGARAQDTVSPPEDRTSLHQEGDAAAESATRALAPMARWLPADTALLIEVDHPAAVLDLLTGPDMTARVEGLPALQTWMASSSFQDFVGLIRYLEASLGTDWRQGVRTLAGGGVTFAVCSDQSVFLTVDSLDQGLLERVHELLQGIARSEGIKAGEDRVKSQEYRGFTGWSFGGNDAHVLIGSRLVISNRPEGLKTLVDRHLDGASATLADTPGYVAARRASGTDVAGFAYANLTILKNAPEIGRALQGNQTNPLAALLFAGALGTLRGADWLAAGLEVADGRLVVRTVADARGGPPEMATFAMPRSPGDGIWPNLEVPRRIAALSLYRDLHGFYAAKDQLFPERSSELIFFENMMGIFFTGRDLTDEVLGETEPEVRLVVSRQQFDPAVGTPRTQLPAFAAVFHLREESGFDEVLQEAWQKALGLVNFTRGQDAKPGLIIDRVTHGECRMTVAYFSTTGLDPTEPLPDRFNYRPTLATPADYLILSSNEQLAADLVDALAREKQHPPERITAANSLLEIDGAELLAILEANRAGMVRNNMIEEGHTEAEAEAAIDTLLAVVGLFDRLEIDLVSPEGVVEGRLEAALSRPL